MRVRSCSEFVCLPLVQEMLSEENKAYRQRVNAQVGRDQKQLEEETEDARRAAAKRLASEKAMAEAMLAAENKIIRERILSQVR